MRKKSIVKVTSAALAMAMAFSGVITNVASQSTVKDVFGCGYKNRRF